MKDRNYKWIVLLFGVIILLPLGIDFVYKLGDGWLDKKTDYTESDILSYVVTVMGLLVSLVALFRAKRLESPVFRIKHARTVDDNNREAIIIEVVNDGIYDCEVLGVGYTDKKHKYHTLLTPPFTVKAKGSYRIVKDVDFVTDRVKAVIENSADSKVYYEISTGIGQKEYVDISDLFLYLDEGKIMGKKKRSARKGQNHHKNQETLQTIKETEVKKAILKEWPAVISIVAAVAVVLMNFLVYVNKRACFDFWGIPREYISAEKGNALYEFFITILVAFSVIAVVNLLWLFVREKVTQHIVMSLCIGVVVAIAIAFGLFLFMWILNGVLLKDISEYITIKNSVFWWQLLLMTLIVMLLCFSCVLLLNTVQKLVAQIKRVEHFNSGMLVGFALMLVASFSLLCVAVYYNQKATCKEEKRLEIVTMGDKTYVVLFKINEEWILKECIVEDEKIYICREEYFFDDISSYPIRSHINVINSESCKLDYDEFIKRKPKCE